MKTVRKYNQNIYKVGIRHRGFSLVETLVAITILMLAVLAPMRIASQSIEAASFAREQLVAVLLAQEGIEAIINLRDDNALAYILEDTSDSWEWFDTLDEECRDAGVGCSYDVRESDEAGIVDCSPQTNCQLYFDASATDGIYYTHESSAGVSTPYTRTITVLEVEADREVVVTSTISWTSPSINQAVNITTRTRLFNQYE